VGAALRDLGPPPYCTVPGMVRYLTAAHGDAELIVAGDERLTYADAEARSAELARGLVALGVCKGTRVGLLAPTGPDWVIAALAAWRTGAVLVPINTFVRAEELAWFVVHADVQTLLARSSFLRHRYLDDLAAAAGFPDHPGPHHVAAFPSLRHVVVIGEGDVPAWAVSAASLPTDLPEGFDAAVEEAVDANDPAVIVYSSGSTSVPKGAIHPHATVVRLPYEVNHRRGLVAADRILMVMPFFWVGGMHHGFLAAYGAGACMMTQEAFDIENAIEAIEREHVTIVFCWPHQAAAISAAPAFATRDTSSLRTGSRNMVLPSDRVEDLTHRSNWLGMSETFGAHLIAPMDTVLPPEARGSSGQSLPGIEHRLVDLETGAECGPGQIGVLDVRGYSLMSGRVRAAREDVFLSDGWYRTGDLGHFDANGFFFFAGRNDDVIKAGGVNVSPDEIETVLRGVDGVKAAYVVGVPDARTGVSVIAAVVARDGAQVDEGTVLDAARARLSAYKVPRRIVVVDEADVPMTATGKVRRGVLAEALASECDK
jgi:acyl-CoA synthetase (AMP-forming)/AMP-acid ligase II